MRARHAEILTGGVCIAIAIGITLYILNSTWHTPGKPLMDHTSFFPLGSCLLISLLGAYQCYKGYKMADVPDEVRINVKGILLILMWVAFGYTMSTLGFLAGGIIFLCISFYLWGERRFHVLLPVGIFMPLLIYIVLGKLLHVSYPRGIIPF